MHINEFVRNHGRLPTDDDVSTSSTLGVSMEYLGMLESQTTKDYIKSRAGVVFHYSDETDHGIDTASLSFRELLDLLSE